MAIPSGSGSEVLKIATATVTGTGATHLITGVANHIYTILSVNVCETNNTTEVFHLYVYDNASTVYYLIRNQTLAPYKTFIYNDRVVLSGTDRLSIQFDSASDTDIVVSYIDQDWT